MKFLFFLCFPCFAKAQSALKYEWRKISGPEQYRIVSPHSATTDVTNLAAGVYKFELKVTNSHNLSARDTMVLTVNPPLNRAWAANDNNVAKLGKSH
jgi:hypothetical protein